MLVPADTPDTSPELSTVATAVLEEVHAIGVAGVPPVPVNWVVDPTHTVKVPEIAGLAFTVTVAVLLQPPTVYVTTSVPAEIPVTNPPLKVATNGFGGVAANVPPAGDPVSVVVLLADPLAYILKLPLIVGIGLTVICIAVDVFGVHPLDDTVLLNQVV